MLFGKLLSFCELLFTWWCRYGSWLLTMSSWCQPLAMMDHCMG